ncbi:antirestriction protein ArdA [Sessilibacter corallicola]|uniref:Antirestriction protein ArdA n=1 Tax=Sessilibacter corallicola TaxID=2904075 RepID=A0ABQ0AA03_9GAMM
MSEDIRIYVADLAAYNNGILHGVWIDSTQHIDDIWDAVRGMLKATPLDEKSEEYEISRLSDSKTPANPYK